MNDRQEDTRSLYRQIYPAAEPDHVGATPPSLLPWLGYAALGLLTVIGLTAGVLALLRLG